MDDSGDTNHSVGVRTCEQLYNWRFYPHPAGHCNNCYYYKCNSGSKVIIHNKHNDEYKHICNIINKIVL
jgi:hypothetical protein